MQDEITIRTVLLFTVVITAALPSLAYSQFLDIDHMENRLHQPDPFANYMLKAENPCNTGIYLEVRKKSWEEMSKQEFVRFKQQSQKCRDYVLAIEDSKPEESIKVSSENPNPLRPYFIIGACATVIAVGIVIVI